jgi:CubicO group peptidase (beta-lactamase class C family)
MIDPRTLDRRDFLRLAGVALSMPLVRCCGASTVAAAQTSSRWPAVQRALDGFVSEGKAAGAAVAISYGDAAPAYPASGTIAFDSSTRFDENSICRIYSITKNVTRIATLLLVEDGKISLDQPVADVLPEFGSLRVAIDIEKGLDARPATKTMTMRHLITNTSGLGNWTPGSESGDALHKVYRERGITPGISGTMRNRPEYGQQVKNLDEMVARVAELPLAHEPGTVLHYSIGFDVMGLVIERVTGLRYDNFLHQRLFGPLDMRSTGFRVEASDVSRLTTNYDATPQKVNSAPLATRNNGTPPTMGVVDAGPTSEWLKQPTLLAGGAGLVSTARDFYRYSGMLLGNGAFEGTRVMKPETARLALSDLSPPGVADPSRRVDAGTRALLLNPLAPPGTFNSAGATGTLFWIDHARAGNVVFMVQAMWGSPANHPYARPLIAAIEQDLAIA